MFLRHFRRSRCNRRKVGIPKVSVDLGTALSIIYLWNGIFRIHALHFILWNVLCFNVIAGDIPHLYTTRLLVIPSLQEMWVFVPWLWIPLGSRHRSLKSMIAKRGLPVEMKYKRFQHRAEQLFWRGLSSGEGVLCFYCCCPNHPLCSFETPVQTSWLDFLFSGSLQHARGRILL